MKAAHMGSLRYALGNVTNRCDGWCVRVDVDWRFASTIGGNDHRVVGNGQHVVLVERATHSGFVLLVCDLVCDNHDLALVSFGGHEHGSLADVDGTWSRLDDYEGRVDGTLGQPGEGADACLEVGNDDGVGFWYGAEQLLSG